MWIVYAVICVYALNVTSKPYNHLHASVRRFNNNDDEALVFNMYSSDGFSSDRVARGGWREIMTKTEVGRKEIDCRGKQWFATRF